MADTFAVLSPPRHRCFACGTCCNGVWIGLDDDEIDRVRRLGAELDVPDPVDDGGLRFEGGACVFLGPDRLCRIHAAHGADAKPHTCRQWPFIAIRTESGLRAGIDPSCAHAWRTWRDGPQATPDGQVNVRVRPLAEPEVRAERALIGLLSAPDATLRSSLHQLTGGVDRFSGRLVTRLQAADLRGFLADDRTGAPVRRTLAPLADAIDAWDPAHPPAFPELSDDMDGFARDATRRLLFLRLAPLVPSVQALALLTLSGALAAAWVDPRPEALGPAISAWTRVIRVRRLWQALTPDPGTMAWLATGQGAPAQRGAGADDG